MSSNLKCPTCGNRVKVGGGNTTHFYLPEIVQDRQQAKDIIQEALNTADRQDEQWRDEDTINLILKELGYDKN